MDSGENRPPAGLFSAAERAEWQTAGPKRRATMLAHAKARAAGTSDTRYLAHRTEHLADPDEVPTVSLERPGRAGAPAHTSTQWRRRERWLGTYRNFVRQGMSDSAATARTDELVTRDGLWRKRCACGAEFLAVRSSARYAPGHDRCRKRVDQDRLGLADRIRWNRRD